MALPEQRRLPGWIEPLILLVLAAALLWPMFQMRFPDHWNWDDGTRIADAHFLREHWPRPGWQPYWFAGISFDSIYPPLIRYAVAGLARGAVRVASPESTARAYWLVIGFALVLGTLGAWRLAAILTGSRWAAAWAGLMLLCVSPGLIFLPAVRADVLAPFRIHVAARYGGGPHAVGLSLMLWALIFTWQALRGGSVRRMILAGAAWAATLAADFPATFTGAILLSLIIWGDWIERRRRRTWIIAAVLPAIALTLNSWWLTPGRLVGALAIMWRNATASSLWAPWLAVGLLLTILVWSERNWAGRAGAAVKTVSLGGALYILFDVTAGVHNCRLGEAGSGAARVVAARGSSSILAGAISRVSSARYLRPG